MLTGIYGGHGQTFIIGMREKLWPAFTRKSHLNYTKTELFKYSDGGQTILAYLGGCFGPNPPTGDLSDRPILLICPGLTSSSYECYVQNLVHDAYKRDFDVVVINHRGLAGCALTSPRLYSGESTIDFREPMHYINKTYGKGRKLMAVGTSLGAHRLCSTMGEDGEKSPLHAACCVQAPMKLWKATNSAKYTMNGIYDQKLGDNMKAVLM